MNSHTLAGLLWEGHRESTRCSRDTYPQSCITEYTLVYEDKPKISRLIMASASTVKVNRGTVFSALVFERGRCVAQSVDGIRAADAGGRGGRPRAQKPPGQTNALYLQ